MIPIYYGEARCGETRALVLSEVRGVLACEQKRPRVTWEEFRRRIRVAAEELARYNTVQLDWHLDNVFLVEDWVVFIDLEMVGKYDDDPEWLKQRVESCVRELNNRYVDYLDYMDLIEL